MFMLICPNMVDHYGNPLRLNFTDNEAITARKMAESYAKRTGNVTLTRLGELIDQPEEKAKKPKKAPALAA